MLKIALCDDDAEQRAIIDKLLREYASQRPMQTVKVSVFSSGSELLSAAEEKGGFTLYVLDVVMPDMSGIELGIRLRELGYCGAIIYLTVSPEYAVDSYTARAFNYLVKPVVPAQLFIVLDQAIAALEKEKAACITVKTKDGLQLVRLDDILYAELAGRSVHYHLSCGRQVNSLTVRLPFQNEVAPLLADSRFFLCGASFVVSLFYVTAVEKGCLRLDGDRKIPLSRGLAPEARRRWSDYWLNSAGET